MRWCLFITRAIRLVIVSSLPSFLDFATGCLQLTCDLKIPVSNLEVLSDRCRLRKDHHSRDKILLRGSGYLVTGYM